MKKYILSILLLTACLAFQRAENENGNIQVSITNVKNGKGELDFNLFNTSDGFPSQPSKAIRHLRGSSVNGSCTVTFENLPFGKYAVSVYHDENNDKKFNESWYGKPIEGVAVSNNVKGSITGPPSFKEASFDLKTPVNKQFIEMHYF